MSTTQMHVVRTPAFDRRQVVEGPLRLTHRGRVVVVGAVLLVVFAALVAFGPSVIATSDEGGREPATVTVHPGETLWDIAGRVNPDGDVRETIDDIYELNGISDAGALPIGAELAVPRY
ncbi:MAG: LysM peptidoglycan-binding domain-containing protein [Nocardioidaceae bacterium]